MIYLDPDTYSVDGYERKYENNDGEITVEDVLNDRVERIYQAFSSIRSVPESLKNDLRQEVWIAVLSRARDPLKYLNVWLDDQYEQLQPKMYLFEDLYKKAMNEQNTSKNSLWDRKPGDDIRGCEESLFHRWRNNQLRPRTRWRNEDTWHEQSRADR